MSTERAIPTTQPLLLRIPEAAALLSCSTGRVYGLIHAGEIPSLRVGTMLRVPRRELEQYIAAEVAAQNDRALLARRRIR